MTNVLALDVGTSSLRAAIYDEGAVSVPQKVVSVDYHPTTAADGAVEMDAEELLRILVDAGQEALRRNPGVRPIGVGCCTYWHSIVGVGAEGFAVTPILLWADTRSSAQVELIKARFDTAGLHRQTGCLPHTSYLPARLLWVKQKRPEWWRAARYWMSPGDYFYWRLLGRRATSVCMASATGLYDHAAGGWHAGLLEFLGLTPEALGPISDQPAEARSSSPDAPELTPELARALWMAPAGDGACSNVGCDALDPGRLAMMVGTSAAMRVAGERSPEPGPPAGLWKYRVDSRQYLIGGALSNGGNVYAWLRRHLRLPEGDALEELLRRPPSPSGLRMLPFLAGERAPGWRGDARGALAGLSWSTSAEDLFRAGIESVALRLALVHSLVAGVAAPDHVVVATGGALLSSRGWTQIIADALQRPIALSPEPQASARGAAILALRHLGAPVDERRGPAEEIIEPRPEHAAYYEEAAQGQAELYERLIAREPRSGEAGPHLV